MNDKDMEEIRKIMEDYEKEMDKFIDTGIKTFKLGDTEITLDLRCLTRREREIVTGRDHKIKFSRGLEYVWKSEET